MMYNDVRFLPIFPLDLFSPVVNVYQTLGRGLEVSHKINFGVSLRPHYSNLEVQMYLYSFLSDPN